MAYIQDSDLEFLQHCDNQDLEVLQHYLVYDTDGEERYTQQLTKKALYRKHHPDHQKYWKNIAEELQLYGANTVMSIFRGGEGVSYREILCDVCERMKVEVKKDQDIEELEANLILKIMTDSIEKMSQEELEQLITQLNLDPANMTKDSLYQILKTSGLFLGSALGVTVAGIVSAAVASTVIGSSIITSAFAGLAGIGIGAFSLLLGPVGMIALGTYSVGGPAFRVTTPSVIQIAYMRMKSKQEPQKEEPPKQIQEKNKEQVEQKSEPEKDEKDKPKKEEQP